jgi:hypothetical protein
MSKQVGMSRNITLEYLNKVIELMNTEDDTRLIKESLQDHLSVYIQDKTNLNKTVNILSNIWLLDADDNKSIKAYARKIVTKSSETTKLVANWCMMLISYSVFKDIASTVGKLGDMQLELTSKVIKEKMLDSWGERTTLIHAIPKNIKTMKDINVLETVKNGVYISKKYEVKDSEAVILIVVTLIHLKNKLYLSIDELINDEAMFPFKYNIDLEMLQESKLFSFDRFGGEMVISLKG